MSSTDDDDWDTGEEKQELGVKCTDSDCERDLHCFKQTRKMANAAAPRGTCRSCNQHLVELDRIRERNPADRAYLFESFRLELIRHHFWHLRIDQKALDHAARKGRRGLYVAVLKRLKSSVGGAIPFRDGTQTPMKGNSIFYAQHATATCCRTCIDYWHGIPKGRELTDSELEFLAGLIEQYLDERLPDLPDDPQYIPRRPA